MVIIALALHEHAFDAPSLTDAASVLTKQVWGPTDCMPIRWKESKLKTPVFRRMKGDRLSEDEAMLYSKLNYDMGRQSLDSGHEKAWTPRFARRGAANAANGMCIHFISVHHETCQLLGDQANRISRGRSRSSS